MTSKSYLLKDSGQERRKRAGAANRSTYRIGNRYMTLDDIGRELGIEADHAGRLRVAVAKAYPDLPVTIELMREHLKGKK